MERIGNWTHLHGTDWELDTLTWERIGSWTHLLLSNDDSSGHRFEAGHLVRHPHGVYRVPLGEGRGQPCTHLIILDRIQFIFTGGREISSLCSGNGRLIINLLFTSNKLIKLIIDWTSHDNYRLYIPPSPPLPSSHFIFLSVVWLDRMSAAYVRVLLSSATDGISLFSSCFTNIRNLW